MMPLDMCGVQCDGYPRQEQLEATNGALILVSSQHLSAKARITPTPGNACVIIDGEINSAQDFLMQRLGEMARQEMSCDVTHNGWICSHQFLQNWGELPFYSLTLQIRDVRNPITIHRLADTANHPNPVVLQSPERLFRMRGSSGRSELVQQL